MPEKTASACLAQSDTDSHDRAGRPYLGPSITWDGPPGVVPQALVRSSDWRLVVAVVSDSQCSIGKEVKRIQQHGS